MFQNPGPASAYESFSPLQLRTAWGVDALGLAGAGHTAVVLEWGQTVAQSDITAYSQQYAGTTITVNQLDGSGSPANGAGLEATLDVETIIGMAPGLSGISLLNYSADDFFSANSYADALDKANTNNVLVDVISVSYGSCETNWPSSAITAIERVLETASGSGVTIVIAAGDQGSSACVSRTAPYTDGTPAAVSYPASSKYVVAAGGASIQLNADNAIADVAVWNDWALQLNADTPSSACTSPPCRPNPVWGGGGGVSSLFQVPSYQTSVNSSGGRGVPDLAYLSDIYPAVMLYFQGQWVGEGNGTSQAAPTFAAMTMLLNQSEGERVGWVNKLLYNMGADSPGVYTDITQGSNIIGNQTQQFDVVGYYADTGWDFASGWGIMNVNEAAEAMAGN